MREIQGIQDLLTYTINQKQTISIQVFTDNLVVLQSLKDLNNYSAPQIMEATLLQLITLGTQGKLVFFHRTFSHKDIKTNEDADISAKKATGWRRTKQRKGNWKK